MLFTFVSFSTIVFCAAHDPSSFTASSDFLLISQFPALCCSQYSTRLHDFLTILSYHGFLSNLFSVVGGDTEMAGGARRASVHPTICLIPQTGAVRGAQLNPNSSQVLPSPLVATPQLPTPARLRPPTPPTLPHKESVLHPPAPRISDAWPLVLVLFIPQD